MLTRSQLPSIPFTQGAYKKLQQELDRLTKLRAEVVIRLTTAREMGDLSENGAYKYAKQELGDIGRQLRQVNYQLKFGHVVTRASSNSIDFGSTVTIKNESRELTFMLVSQFESNPAENKLSTDSPIGSAVVGKKVGDTVTITLPAGETEYTITKVL
ncbi:MAG: transcription elongation factor GreA [Candidatus Woesebacteria bacterium]